MNNKAMVKDNVSKNETGRVKTNGDKTIVKRINDGMNTPVPDHVSTHEPSGDEAALFKQAENPLGNPDKV